MMMKSPTAKPVSATRRSLIAGLLLLPAVALAQRAGSKPMVQMRKTLGCSCCKDWLAHLRDNGFDVATHDVEETVEARRKAGMPECYASYHTGIVQDYALRGYVSAREIKRLLQERPKAIELTVPSMPLGALGTDGPAYGNRRMPYNVLLIELNGQAAVLCAHN